MERKTILEKLGLVEKIENDNPVENSVDENKKKEQNVNTEVQKPQFHDMVKSKINTESKETETNANANDEIDPIAMVKKKKLLKIDEIYKNFDISTEGINSLSIVESFQKALPDYLPTDVKRQSILNIIASSNVRVESLLMDGNEKLRCLNSFSEAYNNEANEVVSSFEYEIKKLTEKINSYKTAIENMKKLHTEQDFTVKYEIEKINNILQFINPEK